MLSVSDSRSPMPSKTNKIAEKVPDVSPDPEFRNDSEEARTLPLLPVRDTVLFPHAVLPLTVGRESSVQLINSLGDDKTIIVVAQREARVDSPQPTDLFTVGSLAVVHKVVRMPNQSLFVFAEGLERVKVTEYAQLTPFMRAGHRQRRPLSAEWPVLSRFPATNVSQL